VTQISGKDAVAKVQSSAGKIPVGARAIALLPAPTGQRIPVRILDVPANRRAVIEHTLRKNIKDIDIVGPDQPARFSVDIEGDTLRLLAADGLQVMATFGLNEPWGDGVATVVSRSSNASELLTLDNPSSQLKIEVRVATAVAPKPTVSTRGIKVVADTQAARYRIRKQGKPRTEQNSLQLEVRVSADSYVTIVDVDSEGGVNLLFPNNYQKRNFYGDGFLRAVETVLIPDTIRPGNKAGFYWDYSPPKGTDTIRVFTSTDLQTAQMIRDRVQSLQTPSAETGSGVRTRSVASIMQSLRQMLATVAARGIITVPDATSHIPGEISAAPDDQLALTAPATMPATGVAEPPPLADQPKPAAIGPTASAAASSPAAPDWTAASVTITISD
jgi:hypothetical protein